MNTRQAGSAEARGVVDKVPTRWWSWWPLLLGPCGVAIVYVAYAADQLILVGRKYQEPMAIGLAMTALLVSLLHLVIGRRPFHLLLVAVAFTVLMREFHWDWTTKFVYASLGLIAVWGLAWSKRLWPFLDQHAVVRVWLFATAATYVLSQALARRAFRDFLPDEQVVHTMVEEVVENVSHAMLIVTALCGPWRASAPPDRTILSAP